MSNYKLIYFNLTGLGEPLRFVLHQSGIKFEDERISFEDWPQLKSQMPLGQLPILEIDGKTYYQSKAIGRLLAKKNNLYGSNDDEAFLVDATIDTFEDLRQSISQYHWEQDAGFKAKLKTTVDTKLAAIPPKLEEQVKKNKGFFVAGKLTWADLVVVAQAEMLSTLLNTDIFKDYPELSKLYQKVRSLPKIKAYLDQRPQIQF